jgi:hypothetical protein
VIDSGSTQLLTWVPPNLEDIPPIEELSLGNLRQPSTTPKPTYQRPTESSKFRSQVITQERDALKPPKKSLTKEMAIRDHSTDSISSRITEKDDFW